MSWLDSLFAPLVKWGAYGVLATVATAISLTLVHHCYKLIKRFREEVILICSFLVSFAAACGLLNIVDNFMPDTAHLPYWQFVLTVTSVALIGPAVVLGVRYKTMRRYMLIVGLIWLAVGVVIGAVHHLGVYMHESAMESARVARIHEEYRKAHPWESAAAAGFQLVLLAVFGSVAVLCCGVGAVIWAAVWVLKRLGQGNKADFKGY